MADTTGYVCATCKRVLDYMPATGQWIHPFSLESVDHVPEPVHPDKVRAEYHCDFCYAINPQYVLPARSFNTSQVGRSVGDWLACEACARLIRDDDWAGVLVRVKEAWQKRHKMALPGPAVKLMEETYRKLRENVTGPLRAL